SVSLRPVTSGARCGRYSRSGTAMESERASSAASPHVERAQRMLARGGHDVPFLRPMRLAAGTSGVAVGFPRDPMVHLSWWALAGGAVLLALVRVRLSR